MVKNLPFSAGDKKHRFDPWRRKWLPTPVFLPGKSHGERSPAGYSPWGCRESDMTERLNNSNNDDDTVLIDSVVSDFAV